MSLFEDYLARGFWLAESERLAIYKYLLKTKKRKYAIDADELLAKKSLHTFIANGEINYSINATRIEYKARKISEDIWTDQIRSINLSFFTIISRSRLKRFFAQAETDVIRNYPLQSDISAEERGFARNVFPYYTLNYYSNGEGKVKGLIKKMQNEDDPLLKRLLTS